MADNLAPMGNCCNGGSNRTADAPVGGGAAAGGIALMGGAGAAGGGPAKGGAAGGGAAPAGVEVLSPAFVYALKTGTQPLGNCCSGGSQSAAE